MIAADSLASFVVHTSQTQNQNDLLAQTAHNPQDPHLQRNEDVKFHLAFSYDIIKFGRFFFKGNIWIESLIASLASNKNISKNRPSSNGPLPEMARSSPGDGRTNHAHHICFIKPVSPVGRVGSLNKNHTASS